MRGPVVDSKSRNVLEGPFVPGPNRGPTDPGSPVSSGSAWARTGDVLLDSVAGVSLANRREITRLQHSYRRPFSTCSLSCGRPCAQDPMGTRGLDLARDRAHHLTPELIRSLSAAPRRLRALT